MGKGKEEREEKEAKKIRRNEDRRGAVLGLD